MHMVRRAQSDPKKQVRFNLGMGLIGMSFGTKLNFCFCFWLDIHKSIRSVHSYGCGMAHLGLRKVILNIKSVKMSRLN